jgi:DNA invertase Pin-like site-specific DNA recombinase
MNESSKVQPHHLERGAYLYIRQSSMRQVIENVESAKRQYALRGRATALGWRDDQIIVIDSDQGESGASASWREGFQRLVTDVGMGHAGIFMGLEVSRLARNNADWHRLGAFKQTTRKSHRISGERARPCGLQAMFF